MLYVSRSLPGDRYGVVDTDDGVEQIVNRMELNNAVIKLGIPIKGVHLGNGYGSDYVVAVTPQQSHETVTRQQAKLKTLKGVDIRTFNGEITAIIADINLADNNMRIRLSDFGDRISWDATIRWEPRVTNKVLILVVDDKIEFLGSNVRANIYRFRWDISEVTNQEIVGMFYNDLIDSELISNNMWVSCIIDEDSRLRMWKCIDMISCGDEFSEELRLSMQRHADWRKTCISVSEKLWKEFEYVSNVDIRVIEALSNHLWVVTTLVSNVLRHDRYPFTVEEDYESLQHSFSDVFSAFRTSAALKTMAGAYFRFENFIKYCYVPKKVKELYIKLCNNTVFYVQEYCKQHHIEL